MHIGKNNPKLEYTMRTENRILIITCFYLIETREEKDLGVWITNYDLKHEKQVIAASQLTVLH